MLVFKIVNYWIIGIYNFFCVGCQLLISFIISLSNITFVVSASTLSLKATKAPPNSTPTSPSKKTEPFDKNWALQIITCYAIWEHQADNWPLAIFFLNKICKSHFFILSLQRPTKNCNDRKNNKAILDHADTTSREVVAYRSGWDLALSRPDRAVRQTQYRGAV